MVRSETSRVFSLGEKGVEEARVERRVNKANLVICIFSLQNRKYICRMEIIKNGRKGWRSRSLGNARTYVL